MTNIQLKVAKHMDNQFVVEQRSLLSILSAMQPICTRRTAVDAVNMLLFQVGLKELVIKGTDLEISLQAHCPLTQANLSNAQSLLVSGRRLFEIIKELEGDIAFDINDQQLNIKSGSVELSLHIKDPQEFPPFPERIENLMQCDAPLFLELLNRVAFLIPQNNANQALNGLYLEFGSNHMRMTVTDGHCLAQVETDQCGLDTPCAWLLPRRAIFELKKILENGSHKTIFIGTCGNQLVFSGDSFNFFSKLLADPFPHYTAVMDKEGFIPAQIERTSFIKTLRRSSCLLSGQFIATKFDFMPEQCLRVSMHNKEVGKLDEDIPVSFEGARLDIRFYSPYLLNGLHVFPDDKVTFYLKSSSRPIIFESTNEKYKLLYLVMPVAPTSGT